MINEPPPLNGDYTRDYNRDLNIKVLKSGGVLIMGLHYFALVSHAQSLFAF